MLEYEALAAFLKNADTETEILAELSLKNMVNVSDVFHLCKSLIGIISNQMNEECDAYTLGEKPMGVSNVRTKTQIFLDLGGRNYYTPRDYKANVSVLRKVQDALYKDSEWRILRINYHLPSLLVMFRPTKEVCEISVTNGLSVQLSSMIGHFFEIQPEAIKFYHFIRIWLEINRVGFKTFNIVLLVIHYLQVCNYMPSAYRAQKNVKKSYIEDCVTSFDGLKSLSDYGVKKLQYYYSCVRGFFQYYANFDYKNYVISTYCGHAIRKIDHVQLDYNSPMCIPAFINQRSNSSHRVTKIELENFIRVCEESQTFVGNAK